jgi:hypothetical protein
MVSVAPESAESRRERWERVVGEAKQAARLTPEQKAMLRRSFATSDASPHRAAKTRLSKPRFAKTV